MEVNIQILMDFLATVVVEVQEEQDVVGGSWNFCCSR
jgi:hypothetical protein